MPSNNPTPIKRGPRAGVILLLLFGAVFAASLVGSVGLAAVRSSAARSAAEEKPRTVSASVPKLADDTEEKLEASFESQGGAGGQQIADVFVDRAGVSKAQAASPSAPSPVLQSALLRSREAVPASLRNPGQPAAEAQPPAAAVPDFATRFAAYNEQLGRGEEPEISGVYSYKELRPIGVVGPDDNPDAAVFYPEPTRRPFSAGVPTKFYDAKLIAITERGVEFQTAAGIVRVGWTKSGLGGQPQSAPGRVTPPAVIPTQSSRAERRDELQDAVAERYAERKPAEAATIPTPSPEATGVEVARPQKKAPRSITRATELPRDTYTEETPAVFLNASYTPSSPEAPDGSFEPSLRGSLFSADASAQAQGARVSYTQTQADEGDAAQATAASTGAGAQQRQRKAEPAPAAREQEAEPAPTPSSKPVETASASAARPDNDAKPAAPPARPRARAPHPNFCEDGFTSERMSLKVFGPTTLGYVLGEIHRLYGVNIIPDADVEDLLVNPSLTDLPWGEMLRTFMTYNDLDARCTPSGAIQLAKRAKLAQIEEQRRKSAPLVEEYIALRYLQVTPQVTVDVAGRANNPSGGAFKTLEESINQLLKESGNTSASVARVPNRNELLVRAPADTLASIKRLIARADRESYVVVLRASTYSADETKLREVGLQTALTLSDAAGFNLGGFSTLPPSNNNSGTGGNAQPVAGLNPGGVPGLPAGFRVPTNGLGAVSPTAVLGGSGLFGTAQFAVQLTALQQKGVVNVQQRPAFLVNNGDTGTLDFGRNVAVAVQAVGPGNIATGQLELLNAGSTFAVTPYVSEDEHGNPAFVTLDVRLENNDVDTSVATSTAPSIIRRAIQTRYVMGNKQTVVFSAFSTDSTTRQRDKVPFLGDIPGVGYLFRRNLDQISRSRTYFTLSVEIVRQSEIINVATPPADASPMPVPPPDPQEPSPYKREKPRR